MASRGCRGPRRSTSVAPASRAPPRAPAARSHAASVVTIEDRTRRARLEEARGRRRPQPRVEHDAGQRPLAIDVARGQQRIVDEHRLGPHCNRIDLAANALRVTVRVVRGHRGARAGRRGNASVEAHRHLQRDERPRQPHVGFEDLVQPPRLGRAHADGHRNAALAQVANPPPATRGLGSSIAATTRAMPASATATAQGPVRPV